jgi:hypothetical protein
MTEQYPIHQINDEVDVCINEQYQRAVVIGLSYTCPVYMCVIQLNEPVEGEFGPQTGFYVPEGVLVGMPDVESLPMWTTVGSYTSVDEDETGELVVLDVQVGIAEGDGKIYVVTKDEVNGKQPVEFTPFSSHEEAEEYAMNHIQENHAAAPGENAEQYLARIEQEGESESAG